MATTLKINLAPTDLPHLIHILPHQIRKFGGQVDEILLTLDLHQSHGRFGTAWKERLPDFLTGGSTSKSPRMHAQPPIGLLRPGLGWIAQSDASIATNMPFQSASTMLDASVVICNLGCGPH